MGAKREAPCTRNTTDIKQEEEEQAEQLMNEKYMRLKRRRSRPPHSMHDLWKASFSFLTPWSEYDSVYGDDVEWDFSHLEKEFDAGIFHHAINHGNRNVYLFGTTELRVKETMDGVYFVPVVVAIVSPHPPSQELAFIDVNNLPDPRGDRNEDVKNRKNIFPMKDLKMDWVPYIPFYQRKYKVIERSSNQRIFVLGCTQRKAAFKSLNKDRCLRFQFSEPYVEDDHKVMTFYNFYPLPSPHSPKIPHTKMGLLSDYCPRAHAVF